MAQFNADIQLKVLVDGLNQAVNKVNNAVEKIEKKGLQLNARISKGFATEIDRAAKSVERLSNILKTVGVGGGAAGLVSLINALGQIRGINLGPLEQAAGALAKLTDPMLQAAASAPGLTAGIIGATAAAAAFSPQIADVVKQLGKVVPVAQKASLGIQQAFNVAALMAFGPSIRDNVEYVKNWENVILSAGDKVKNLQDRLAGLKKGLNLQNSATQGAANTARKYVEIQARLNDELREQNDLLRRARGVNVTELEAAKGRKSIETGQKRDQFLARQAQEAERVQKSLLDLAKAQAEVDNARLNARAEQEQIRQEQMVRAANDETIKSLERRIQIEERIANVRSARAAREANQRAQFLAGNPNQYEVGAFRPDSTIFQRNQAALKAAQARLAANQQNLKANSANVFQLQKNLALLNQIAKIGKQIDQSTQNELKNQRRLNRELKVRQGRAKQQKGGQLSESLALGVGFPLLFGGGAGSVLGSGAGSFAGSGFGGQILGGAIGQAIDQYVQGLTKLAQSLESTQGVITGLEEAGYSVSAATKGVIESYQSAGLEAEAYQLAIDEINRVLGPDGASKLSDYRIETENLSKEFEKAKAALDSELLPALTGTIRLILQLKGAFDTLAGSPLFKFISGLNNAASTALPGIGPAIGAFGAAQDAGAVSGNVVLPESQRLAQEDAKLQKLTQQTEELTKQQEKQWEIDDTTRRTNETLEAQIAIERAGTDIKDDNVYKKRQEAIEQVYLNAVIDAGTNAEKRRNAELTKTLALLKLDNQRSAAFSRGGGGGGVDKEAQTQKAIAAQLTKQFELETKLATIGVTKLDKINTELERLDQRKALKVAELELSKEDERIKALKLENLNKETEILRQQLELQRERAQLEQQMTALKGEQQIAGLQRGLDQELAGLTLPSGSSFQDERDQLALKQQNRYANAITEVNDLITQQQLLATSSDAAIAEAATKKLELLERQKGVYETMLPAIAQAEQQQLRFNQTLSLVEGPVNAFVSGLTSGLQGIIDGTMTAEEAFANMLKGMADALIQTATQMIAQYIAIGIARAFAGMGGGGSFGSGASAPLTSGLDFSSAFRADGGPVNANRPYMVGERGPELFVPSSPGTVVTSEQSRAQLDMYSPGNAVDAPAGPMNVNMNYSGPTMAFDDKRYVPVEAIPGIIKDAAKQGEQRTLASMRNRVSTRNRVGI